MWMLSFMCSQDLWYGNFDTHCVLKIQSTNILMITQKSVSLYYYNAPQNMF
jgi:hypothetical protein